MLAMQDLEPVVTDRVLFNEYLYEKQDTKLKKMKVVLSVTILNDGNKVFKLDIQGVRQSTRLQLDFTEQEVCFVSQDEIQDSVPSRVPCFPCLRHTDFPRLVYSRLLLLMYSVPENGDEAKSIKIPFIQQGNIHAATTLHRLQECIFSHIVKPEELRHWWVAVEQCGDMLMSGCVFLCLNKHAFLIVQNHVIMQHHAFFSNHISVSTSSDNTIHITVQSKANTSYTNFSLSRKYIFRTSQCGQIERVFKSLMRKSMLSPQLPGTHHFNIHHSELSASAVAGTSSDNMMIIPHTFENNNTGSSSSNGNITSLKIHNTPETDVHSGTRSIEVMDTQTHHAEMEHTHADAALIPNPVIETSLAGTNVIDNLSNTTSSPNTTPRSRPDTLQIPTQLPTSPRPHSPATHVVFNSNTDLTSKSNTDLRSNSNTDTLTEQTVVTSTHNKDIHSERTIVTFNSNPDIFTEPTEVVDICRLHDDPELDFLPRGVSRTENVLLQQSVNQINKHDGSTDNEKKVKQNNESKVRENNENVSGNENQESERQVIETNKEQNTENYEHETHVKQTQSSAIKNGVQDKLNIPPASMAFHSSLTLPKQVFPDSAPVLDGNEITLLKKPHRNSGAVFGSDMLDVLELEETHPKFAVGDEINLPPPKPCTAFSQPHGNFDVPMAIPPPRCSNTKVDCNSSDMNQSMRMLRSTSHMDLLKAGESEHFYVNMAQEQSSRSSVHDDSVFYYNLGLIRVLYARMSKKIRRRNRFSREIKQLNFNKLEDHEHWYDRDYKIREKDLKFCRLMNITPGEPLDGTPQIRRPDEKDDPYWTHSDLSITLQLILQEPPKSTKLFDEILNTFDLSAEQLIHVQINLSLLPADNNWKMLADYIGLVNADISIIEHFCYTYRELAAKVVLLHWMMQCRNGNTAMIASTNENLMTFLRQVDRQDVLGVMQTNRENESMQREDIIAWTHF